jgi:hypothetical protein
LLVEKQPEGQGAAAAIQHGTTSFGMSHPCFVNLSMSMEGGLTRRTLACHLLQTQLHMFCDMLQCCYFHVVQSRRA